MYGLSCIYALSDYCGRVLNSRLDDEVQKTKRILHFLFHGEEVLPALPDCSAKDVRFSGSADWLHVVLQTSRLVGCRAFRRFSRCGGRRSVMRSKRAILPKIISGIIVVVKLDAFDEPPRVPNAVSCLHSKREPLIAQLPR